MHPSSMVVIDVELRGFGASQRVPKIMEEGYVVKVLLFH